MFDENLIIKNKLKSSENIKKSDFYDFVYSDLKDRLDSIEKSRNRSVLVDFTDYSLRYFNGLTYISYLQLKSINTKSVDLLVFPFCLHWVSNVREFFFEVKRVLKEDGIFICNFLGDNSLSFLRKFLFLAEEFSSKPHLPHISPFIRFTDISLLFQKSGFIENIADYEMINIEFDSPVSLMKSLKKFGESNAIKKRINYSITKSMYSFLKNYGQSTFSDQLKLVNVISSPKKNSIKIKI